MKIIITILILTLSLTAHSQLLVDDFSTGEISTISFDNGESTKSFQKGTTILGKLRRLHVKVGENIYNQKPQLTINENDVLAYSSGYDVNSTIYLSYGYDENGPKQLNQDLSNYSKIKIEFAAKSAKTGIYLTMFTRNDRAAYSSHVPEREGKLVCEIPFNKMRKIGEKFTFKDIDHFIFQFDSRSKTGCNMAINKIWFE